jgi:hypothetical protein
VAARGRLETKWRSACAPRNVGVCPLKADVRAVMFSARADDQDSPMSREAHGCHVVRSTSALRPVNRTAFSRGRLRRRGARGGRRQQAVFTVGADCRLAERSTKMQTGCAAVERAAHRQQAVLTVGIRQTKKPTGCVAVGERCAPSTNGVQVGTDCRPQNEARRSKTGWVARRERSARRHTTVLTAPSRNANCPCSAAGRAGS